MKVLVLGGGGMLGHKLAQRLSNHFDVYATVRGRVTAYADLTLFRDVKLIGGVDLTQDNLLEEIVSALKPDVIINAVGVVKQGPMGNDPAACHLINEELPHRIAAIAEEVASRAILIGTDCVFSGSRGNYTEEDAPDATDLYGTTKFRGEVSSGAALTIRTSIIGRELEGAKGLLEWFLSQRGTRIKGYSQAIFSGFPTVVLAEILKTVIIDFPGLRGLYHVSSDPISKFELLSMLNQRFDCGIAIDEDDSVRIDRSLDSSRFRAATGFIPAGWAEMVDALHADSQGYEEWRRK